MYVLVVLNFSCETPRENVIVTTVESRFFQPPGEEEIGSNYRAEKSGVKLQCLTGEGKSGLVRIIGSFKKPGIREIGILLYFGCYQ